MNRQLLMEEIPYRASLIKLKAHQTISIPVIQPAIVFVREASLTIISSTKEEISISKGQFFLLPMEFPCFFISEEDQEVLHMEIPNVTELYIHFFSVVSLSHIIHIDKLFFPLTMTSPILRLWEDMDIYIKDKKLDRLLCGIKTLELFHLINHSFTIESIETFFIPALTQEYNFALFVWKNHAKVKTAQELARLSNYTFSGFDKQFRKVFGLSPYKWMLQKKIDLIYHEIHKTSKPMKVIADEYGFSGISNLGDFCRSHLGHSPTTIRKKGYR